MNKISIVVPTLNEEKNIKPLVEEISSVLKKNYEVIFIDDNSTDGTIKEIKKLESKYPVRVFTKKGKKGKTFSLIEGFKKAKFEILGMIDADLQYPPKYLREMLAQIDRHGADVVVTHRREYDASFFRKILSGFGSAFITLFFGLNFDTQSGLKIFKREVYEAIDITTENEWTFDIDFLVKAKKKGYRIESIDIQFNPRLHGESKVYNNKGTKRAAYKEIFKMRFGS